MHISHTARHPRIQTLIKRRRTGKHLTHIGHTAGVPITDVLIEGVRIFEHPSHVCYIARVPRSDVRMIKRVSVPKSVLKADDRAGQHRWHRNQVSCSPKGEIKTR